MEVILDSSFVISAVKRKIDFISDLKELGFRVKVPKEVLQEMKDLSMKDKTKRADREAIKIALEIISREKLSKVRLGNKIVDQGLIDKGVMGSYIATLDREIKRQVPNRVVISDAKNSVVIDRD